MKRCPLFLTIMALLIAFGVLLWVLPARDFSELENRTLADLPAADPVTLTNGQWGVALESYAADHFPLRDELVSARASLHILTGDALLQDTLIGADGWLFETPPAEATRVARLSVQALNELTEALDLPGTLLLIPTSAAILPEKLPALYHVSGDQRQIISSLYAEAPAMTCVANPIFDHPGDEALYYRTDHHLTADGAALCSEALRAAMDLPQVSGERVRVSGFLGSYYARVPSVLIAPETFTADLPDVRVTIDSEAATFLDETALARRNKYAALLSGTYTHVVLENPAGEGSLLVLCDSYGNAVVPSLASGFARVDMIDMRYYTGDLLALTEEAGTTQFLALYGLNTISTNRSLLLMDIPERRLP